jgi:hypothetical protein
VLNGVGSAGQQDGVVVDEDGGVIAYWGSFSVQVSNGGRLQNVQVFQGIPSDIIAEAVEPLKHCGEANPSIRSLGVEFECVSVVLTCGSFITFLFYECCLFFKLIFFFFFFFFFFLLFLLF